MQHLANDPARAMRENAEAVSAVVACVQSMSDAVDYALDLCAAKDACEPLLQERTETLSGDAASPCPRGWKTLAAPDLSKKDYALLEKRCRAAEVFAIRKGMRAYAGGVDLALTRAAWGVAATGTLVLDSNREDLRLATMLAEIHVAVLPVSRIVPDLEGLGPKLDRMMQGPAYTAFITGASRTADIERVLTLGVHGPLELHILLLEED